MPDSPTITPISADRIGSPIATNVPNVKARTISAIVRPTTSLLSVAGFDSFEPSGPPADVLRPACLAAFASSRIPWALSIVTLPSDSAGYIEMNATVPSLLTWAAPAWSSGLMTFATSGFACSALTLSSIALV